MNRTSTRRPGDQGAGSVTVLATVFLTLALLGATAALGTAATAAARASGAADLAALAAADAARGLALAEPCALAAQTADRHGATVIECAAASDGTVLVRTRYESPLPWPSEGVARAGPPASTVPR
ncbi:Rv3654c family TadE-like protein [Citricoccus sp. K5]|uniref:Rv3654c family TadE-like protein n=1 Tax=Citricoccus sp. K5 TaxID=2653135 RepID=UPI0012F470F8|nr:Rv3654c family TadE-like protein [Citricoccus sp. K5]VXB77352.1 Secretion/DNA translocation related TadE-like protein [Citricoccus sp. K5]